MLDTPALKRMKPSPIATFVQARLGDEEEDWSEEKEREVMLVETNGPSVSIRIEKTKNLDI